MAEDPSTPKESSTPKDPSTPKEISTPKYSSTKKAEDYIIKNSPEASPKATPNIIALNPQNSPKRPSSVDITPKSSTLTKAIPGSSKKSKRHIPEAIKNKLLSLSRESSVVRKYSAEKFRESPSSKACNSIDRLKQNLARFKKNAMFQKGSEEERSVRSILSRESKE